MLRRILIPLDPSPYTEVSLEYGCLIAKQHHAEITGMAVLDTLGIEDAIGPIPFPGFYHAVKLLEFLGRDAREHIQGLLEKFNQKCEKEGVAYQSAEYQGIPSEGILHESIFYDLVIIGLRTYFDFEISNKPGKSLEKILDHSVTPVLAVPDAFKWTEKVVKALIAFDGSLPAARALQRFAQLARNSDYEITLLMSDKEEKIATHYLDRAETYLRAHSIPNIKKEWISKNIIEAMEETYLDWADLVVAGAHSKKGIVDFAVGSLVKYLIKTAKKPILLGV